MFINALQLLHGTLTVIAKAMLDCYEETKAFRHQGHIQAACQPPPTGDPSQTECDTQWWGCKDIQVHYGTECFVQAPNSAKTYGLMKA